MKSMNHRKKARRQSYYRKTLLWFLLVTSAKIRPIAKGVTRNEPQNPYFEQQTFKGHFSLSLHWAPQPGSHSDFESQLDVQFSAAQNVGPSPLCSVSVSTADSSSGSTYQTPVLPQQPSLQGLVDELDSISIAFELECRPVIPCVVVTGWILRGLSLHVTQKSAQHRH